MSPARVLPTATLSPRSPAAGGYHSAGGGYHHSGAGGTLSGGGAGPGALGAKWQVQNAVGGGSLYGLDEDPTQGEVGAAPGDKIAGVDLGRGCRFWGGVGVVVWGGL